MVLYHWATGALALRQKRNSVYPYTHVVLVQHGMKLLAKWVLAGTTAVRIQSRFPSTLSAVTACWRKRKVLGSSHNSNPSLNLMPTECKYHTRLSPPRREPGTEAVFLVGTWYTSHNHVHKCRRKEIQSLLIFSTTLDSFPWSHADMKNQLCKAIPTWSAWDMMSMCIYTSV